MIDRHPSRELIFFRIVSNLKKYSGPVVEGVPVQSRPFRTRATVCAAAPLKQSWNFHHQGLDVTYKLVNPIEKRFSFYLLHHGFSTEGKFTHWG